MIRAFIPTSLDIYEWFKVSDIHGALFKNAYLREAERQMDRYIGLQQTKAYKLGAGFGGPSSHDDFSLYDAARQRHDHSVPTNAWLGYADTEQYTVCRLVYPCCIAVCLALLFSSFHVSYPHANLCISV